MVTDELGADKIARLPEPDRAWADVAARTVENDPHLGEKKAAEARMQLGGVEKPNSKYKFQT